MKPEGMVEEALRKRVLTCSNACVTSGEWRSTCGSTVRGFAKDGHDGKAVVEATTVRKSTSRVNIFVGGTRDTLWSPVWHALLDLRFGSWFYPVLEMDGAGSSIINP